MGRYRVRPCRDVCAVCGRTGSWQLGLPVEALPREVPELVSVQRETTREHHDGASRACGALRGPTHSYGSQAEPSGAPQKEGEV